MLLQCVCYSVTHKKGSMVILHQAPVCASCMTANAEFTVMFLKGWAQI